VKKDEQEDEEKEIHSGLIRRREGREREGREREELKFCTFLFPFIFIYFLISKIPTWLYSLFLIKNCLRGVHLT